MGFNSRDPAGRDVSAIAIMFSLPCFNSRDPAGRDDALPPPARRVRVSTHATLRVATSAPICWRGF